MSVEAERFEVIAEGLYLTLGRWRARQRRERRLRVGRGEPRWSRLPRCVGARVHRRERGAGGGA
jgi:hypothetical protein